MKTLRKVMVMAAVLALLAAAVPDTARAQDTRGNIMLVWNKAFMEDTGILNSSFGLYYMRPIGGFELDFHLPFALYDPDQDGVDGESALGNPRIGLNKYNEGSPLMYRAGVRLPLAPDDKTGAHMVGQLSDPFYMGTWYAKAVSVDAGAAYFKNSMEGLGYWLSLGLEVVYDTDAPDGADSTEFFLPFTLAGTYPLGSGTLMAGLAGSYWVSEDDGYAGDNPAYLMAGVGFKTALGKLRPEVWLGLPLSSDYSDLVDFLLTIGIGFGIP